MSRVALSIAAVVLLSGTPRAADEKPPARAEAKPPRVVAYRDDKLTLHVAKVPAAEVLKELGRQSGAEIRGEVRGPRDVSLDFDDVSLSEGLQRLLGDQNFTLGYADDGRLRSVELFGGPLAPPEKTAAAAPVPQKKPWPPDENAKRAADSLYHRFTDDKELPVTGRLAEALGTNRVTFKRLTTLAVHADDPRIRSRAFLASMNVIESDPDLRTAFVTTLDSIDDESLAHALRQFGAEHAEELVERFGRHTREASLRGRTGSVLQYLSGMGPEK